MLDLRMLVSGIVVVLCAVGLASLGIAIATREPDASPPHARTIDDARDAAVAELAPTRADAGEPDAGPYALDGLPREGAFVAAGCPEVPLIDRAGEPVPWRPALRIHPEFEPAVRRLERAILESALEVYGVAPARMLSASTYRCRTIRERPERVSEHALGNAIDLRGIVLPDEREITVREHWHAVTPEDAPHARFWRRLVQRVTERAVFRGVIGPPTDDHLDHLHFDLGPSRFHSFELEP
jgi:hypothetical protein